MKSLKKICFIAQGGPHAKNWLNYLTAQKDFQVYYIGGTIDKRKNIKSCIIPFNGIIHYILLIIASQIIVRIYKPNIIISQYLTFHGFIASLIGHYPKISIGIGSDINLEPQNLIYSKLNQYTVQHSKEIIVVSELLKEKLKKSGAPEKKIVVIPNALDETIIKTILSTNLREDSYKKSSKGFKIIYTRGLNPIYDPLTLMRAILLVLKIFPETKFYIAGEGSLKRTVENIIKKKKLERQVFLLGWVDEQELSKLHKESQIYVSTSLSDGLSIALLKGIVFNNIIIASDIEANSSLASTINLDRKTFLLFPCGDYKDLAIKIIYVIENYNQLQSSLDINQRIIIGYNELFH